MGYYDDMTVMGQIVGSPEDAEIEISLDETPEFTYDCIQTINNQYPLNGHMVISGDECTQILMQPGQLIINDMCLPPCWQCNERLTEGDVHLIMESLEARVSVLE